MKLEMQTRRQGLNRRQREREKERDLGWERERQMRKVVSSCYGLDSMYLYIYSDVFIMEVNIQLISICLIEKWFAFVLE